MISHERDGTVDFRIYLPHAASVGLVGSFTGWKHGKVWLTADGEGWWSARVEVPTGEHEFSYLVDDRFWMPDYAASGLKRHESGQLVSALTVLEKARPVLAPVMVTGVAARPTPGRDAFAVRPTATRRGPAISTSAPNGPGRTLAASVVR